MNISTTRRVVPAAFPLRLIFLGCIAIPFLLSAGIRDRITTVSVTLPAALEGEMGNWCLWTSCRLGPRLYHVPRSDGTLFIGWTDSEGNGHVGVFGPDGFYRSIIEFPDRLIRGLVVHDDSSFAVLLLDQGSTGLNDDVMHLSKCDASGNESWSTSVTGPKTVPNTSSRTAPGDSRLAYGNGIYAAYTSVHGIADFMAGHEGDALTFVDDLGKKQSGGWTWGLSHSMSTVAGFHPGTEEISTYGVSDCYPKKGLHSGKKTTVMSHHGNCGGLTAVELGQMAAAANGAWLVVFAAESRSGYEGKGIGIVRHRTGAAQPMWLTNTNGDDERDPVIARIGTSLTSNRFLVGWRFLTVSDFVLGIIDTTGSFLEPVETVSPDLGWGRRNDSFRTGPEGAVTWVEGDAGSTTIRLHRYEEQSEVTRRRSRNSRAADKSYPHTFQTFDIRGRMVHVHQQQGHGILLILSGKKSVFSSVSVDRVLPSDHCVFYE